MTPSQPATARQTHKPAAADASIAALERPTSGRRQCARLRQRRRRRNAKRARDSLYRGDAGRELSRPARQHRQLSRQHHAADAALRARGSRRRHRARLRQGHRQGDRRRRAFQCRPAARHHGDVQRLVRPHAGPRPRRHRPGRRHEAAAVDRLDPHRARPGRADPRLHQMGRPAGLGRAPRAKRCCAAPGSPTPRRMGPVYINLDAEMQEAKLAEPLPPIDAARYMPPVVDRGARPIWCSRRRRC